MSLRYRTLVLLAGSVLLLALSSSGTAQERGAQPEKPTARDALGDPLPDGCLARLGTTRLRPFVLGTGLAFLPDSKRLLSCDFREEVIRIWDPETGKELPSPFAGDEFVIDLALSHDGKKMASMTTRGKIRMYDLVAERPLGTFSVEAHLESLAVSPDGRLVAAGGEGGTLGLWDVATAKRVHRLEGHKATLLTVAFSPDGALLASGGTARDGDEPILLWDVKTGNSIASLKGQPGRVSAVAFSPDGSTLAAASTDSVRLWDVKQAREMRQWKGSARTLVYSPDGKLLVWSGSNGTLTFCDPATGKILFRQQADPRYVASLAFSPDGKTLASYGGSRRIHLWNVATGKELCPLPGHQGQVVILAFAPDGKTLHSFGDRTIRSWQVPAGKEISRIELPDRQHWFWEEAEWLRHRTVLLDGKTWVMPELQGWDLTTGKPSFQLQGHRWSADAMALSRDGQTFAAVDRDGMIRLWDPATQKGLRGFVTPREASTTVSLIFSPDSEVLVSFGRGDRVIRFWDWTTGRQVRQIQGPKESLNDIAFAPDGRLLAVLAAPFLRIWDTATGDELRQFKCNSACIAFSPDGRLLASGGSEDGTIRLWDVLTGKEVGKFEGHRGKVHCVAFSPDGKLLASGGQDTTVLLWDLSGLKLDLPVTAPDATELDRLWTDLAAEKAATAYEAVAAFASARDKAPAFLKEYLKPVPEPDPKRVARLLADLDSKKSAVRDAARQALEKEAELVAPAIRRALQGQPSPEVKRTLEALLPVPGVIGDTDTLRALRALQALERIGTPDARAVIVTLARGAPGARLTREARAALARLDLRQPSR